MDTVADQLERPCKNCKLDKQEQAASPTTQGCKPKRYSFQKHSLSAGKYKVPEMLDELGLSVCAWTDIQDYVRPPPLLSLTLFQILKQRDDIIQAQQQDGVKPFDYDQLPPGDTTQVRREAVSMHLEGRPQWYVSWLVGVPSLEKRAARSFVIDMLASQVQNNWMNMCNRKTTKTKRDIECEECGAQLLCPDCSSNKFKVCPT